MLTNGIVAYLLAQADITAIAGNSIQPIPAPVEMSDYPAIVYQVASDMPSTSGPRPDGVRAARIVFNCFAPYGSGGYLIARSLAQAVEAAFIAIWEAIEEEETQYLLPDGTELWSCQVVNSTDNFANDAKLSQASVHVKFMYTY
jgi:hypothetical protein